MAKRGRPETRNNEALMIAIYKLVNRSMIANGSKNISKACRSAIKKSKIIKVFASKEDGSRLLENLNTVDQLRKRFHYAKSCSMDAVNFPALHQIVLQMEEKIDENIASFNKSKIDIERYKNFEQELNKF